MIMLHTIDNSNCTDRKWYVVYTYPKAEHKAKQKLEENGILSFLPVHEVVRQWSDRKKKLKVPLFPNYIFVKILPHEKSEVLKLRELVKFVSFEGEPAIVPEKIIESLRNFLKGKVEVSNENFSGRGAKVKIKDGQFIGTEGVLIRKSGRTRLSLRIEVLNKNVSIDVPANCVELINNQIPNY